MLLQRSRQGETVQKNINQAEMSESEGIQAIGNEAAVQAATVVVALRDAYVGP